MEAALEVVLRVHSSRQYTGVEPVTWRRAVRAPCCYTLLTNHALDPRAQAERAGGGRARLLHRPGGDRHRRYHPSSWPQTLWSAATAAALASSLIGERSSPSCVKAHALRELISDLPGVSADSLLVLPLHASLPQEDQARVFAPAPRGARKVILATNVAETSLTIPGVRVIVDLGLCKEKRFDAERGMDLLTVVPISQSSAKQRAGRAGRTAAGDVYRLYTEAQLGRMEAEPQPEIARSHLANVVLQLKAMGITGTPAGPQTRGLLTCMLCRGRPTSESLPCDRPLCARLARPAGAGRAAAGDAAALPPRRARRRRQPDAQRPLDGTAASRALAATSLGSSRVAARPH